MIFLGLNLACLLMTLFLPPSDLSVNEILALCRSVSSHPGANTKAKYSNRSEAERSDSERSKRRAVAFLFLYAGVIL